MSAHATGAASADGSDASEGPSSSPSRSSETPPPGTGLLGEYWKLLDQPLHDFPHVAALAPAIRRIDPRVEFRDDKSFGFPFAARNVAARWRGFLFAPDDGDYVFRTGSDDGSWLSIDGVEVIGNGGLHHYIETGASRFLSRGFHTIAVCFFQNEGAIGVVLEWARPGHPVEVVPQEVLYPPEALAPVEAPRITAVMPPRARWGESIEIEGEGFPAEGAPALAMFDGVPMPAEAIGPGRLRATLPPGVDRGDIIVGDAGAPSQGFPYEAGDVFGLLGEYHARERASAPHEAVPPPGAAGGFRRVDEVIGFGSREAFAIPLSTRPFAVRWRGKVHVRAGGAHAFKIGPDDGARISIDGVAVAGDGDSRGERPVGSVDLEAGFHSIEVELLHSGGDTGIHLEWMRPGSSGFTLVPRRVLYAPADLAVHVPPEVLAIEPPRGFRGAVVSVIGRGFAGDGAGDHVVFADGQVAQVEASSPTRLLVRVPDLAQSGRVVVQSGELEAPGGARFDVLEGGLTGAYHQLGRPHSTAPGVEGRAPTLVRVDSTLDFGEDLSFALPFETEHFAVFWTGAIVAPADGDYVLALRSGDPARLFVDGERVVEVEGGHPRRIIEGRASLAAGPHAVRIEFVHHGEGVATISFGWRPPGGKLAIVPQSALLPEAP